jgi:hypothetical protein
MNIIVDRPRLSNIILQFLNKNFGNLKPKISENHPRSIFYVDSNDEILIEYENSRVIFIHEYKICEKLNLWFHINMSETNTILKYWLEQTYNIECLELTRAMVLSWAWKKVKNLNDI